MRITTRTHHPVTREEGRYELITLFTREGEGVTPSFTLTCDHDIGMFSLGTTAMIYFFFVKFSHFLYYMRCAEIALPGKTYATYSWNIIFLRRAFYVMDPKCRRKGGIIVGETLFSQKSLIVRKQNTSENVKKLILFLKNKKKVFRNKYSLCAQRAKHLGKQSTKNVASTMFVFGSVGASSV